MSQSREGGCGIMSDLITIENTEMQIREYNGQRVVTFKDIDTVHGNKNGTARRNFNRNKKYFIENEDYFVLTKEISNETNCPNRNLNETNSYIENSNGRNSSIRNIDVPNKGITVLTETGYLLIAKSFSDDLSWAVQRQLVNSYFRGTSDTSLVQTDLADNRLHQTSSTPLPKNPTWYARNLRNMEIICTATHKPMSYLAHKILVRVGEEYNMDEAKKIYEKELGEPPKYPLDIINYFPELAEIATDYVRKLVLQIVKDVE